MAHNITFSPDAWADYLYWQSEDKKTLKRINKLLQELQRDGAVQGIGKAELLRKIKGMSKRIDDTNRLVYTAESVAEYLRLCIVFYAVHAQTAGEHENQHNKNRGDDLISFFI